MKNKKQSTKKLELDVEVVADLEANDAETEAIRGGRSSSGGVASGSGPVGSAGT